MARHTKIAASQRATMYLCDTHSPRQSPLNEKTNGLGHYFRKGPTRQSTLPHRATDTITTVPLADGTHASVGDLVVTRRNDRTLRLGPTDWVKTGDRWRITQVHGGSVDARHLHEHRTLRLPADYAREHVQLGYAATIHGAQGMPSTPRTPSSPEPRTSRSPTSPSAAAAHATTSTSSPPPTATRALNRHGFDAASF
jgi:hypothetical protein